jgi:hypothetical protein
MAQYTGVTFGVVAVVCAIVALSFGVERKPGDKLIVVSAMLFTFAFLAASVTLLK